MYLNNQLTALAIIPGLLLIIYVYGKDKVEKEPIGLIVKLIIFGAITTQIAAFAEQTASSFFPQYAQGTVGYALVNGVCLAAFWEELLKFLALRLGSWKHPSFNYRFDGIVYGVSVAVGFALLENVMYVAMFGFQTAIVRAFTAVPLHAFAGMFMGVMYSYSKKAAILGQSGTSAKFTFLALLVPMFIHGTYDFLAMLGYPGIQILFYAFVIVLYIAAIKTINKMSAEDRKGSFYPSARVIDYDCDL